MAKVSLKNLHQTFRMDDIFPPEGPSLFGPNLWYAGLRGGHNLSVLGRNLTVNSESLPTTGTVTRVEIDLNRNNSSNPDIVVSGLSADFARLDWTAVGPVTDAPTSYLYAMLLEGDDTIELGNNATREGFTIHFSADGTWATTFCGDDTIRGDAGASAKIYGDIQEVKTNFTRYGGDDDIRLSKSDGSQLSGDVLIVWMEATLVAGDDYISVSRATVAYGDAIHVRGHLAAGDDTLIGSDQNDTLFGDAGTLHANSSMRGGNDLIKGGGGVDMIVGDVSELKDGGQVVEGGNDTLYGGGGNDSLTGQGGKDSLDGGSGNDYLRGDEGNDVLKGGAGRDWLDGGTGRDKLTGDAGKDLFYFHSFDVYFGADTITDFRRGEDRIALDGFEFSFVIGDKLNASEFVARKSGHKAGDGDYIIYDKKTGKLWFDADDDGPGAAIHFATLANKPQNLSHTDFDVV